MTALATAKKVGVVAVGLAVLYVIAAVIVAAWVYSSTKNFIAGNLGWETRTAGTLAWVAMLVFTGGGLIAAARIIFFGSRNPALYVSAILPVLIPWGLDLIYGKPVTADGEIRLCCNKRPKRELFCRVIEQGAACGFDPITRDQLHLATRKERLVWSDNRSFASIGPLIMPVPIPKPDPCKVTAFFDETGPLLWYFERNGKIELFDDDDVHPRYGERLRPITRDIVDRLERSCQAPPPPPVAASPPPAPAPTNRTKAPVPSETRPEFQATRAEAAVPRRYWDHPSIQSLGDNHPLVIKGQSDLTGEITEALGGRLRTGVFASAFVADGLFDRAASGDHSAVADLHLPAAVRRIVLAKVDPPKNTSLQGVPDSVRILRPIVVVLVDAQTGRVLETHRIVAEGSGFSEHYALASLREDLAQKLAAMRRLL